MTTDSVQAAQFSSEVIKWQDGDKAKANPVFIVALNNIALERPGGSGNFVPDLVGFGGQSADKIKFTDSAEFIFRSIFGKPSKQAERLLMDSPHASKIRFWSIYVWGLAPNASTSLVEERDLEGSAIISPRRGAIPTYLQYIGIDPDIVFVVSNSPTHTRASAYGTTDDDARGGVPFTYDGSALVHRYFHRIPGMAAIHTTAYALTAAHEFGHAFSSYTNGFITDLYVDGAAAFNRKVGRPIPTSFANYSGQIYKSDPTRDGLNYPAGWQSYHSELVDPTRPALMDNYWLTQDPMQCKHDLLTKKYILDRVAAKVSR